MNKTFDEKSAYELEQEMYQRFNGVIDEIAIHYGLTNEKYLAELYAKRMEIVGIYTEVSPYHNRKYFLPFCIFGYNPEANTFSVGTVEFKGKTAYKANANYTEKNIHDLMTDGIIVRKADFSDRNKPEIEKLLNRYRTAN